MTNLDRMKPVETGGNLEELRVYHAHLDLLNEMESPDPTKADW